MVANPPRSVRALRGAAHMRSQLIRVSITLSTIATLVVVLAADRQW
jgi:hypothetical protein